MAEKGFINDTDSRGNTNLNPYCSENTNKQVARCRPVAVVHIIRGIRMPVLDPWSKAVECDHAIERVADPERRVVLESLRSVWIEVCDARSLFNGADQPQDLSIITQIHTELMASYRMAMH